MRAQPENHCSIEITLHVYILIIWSKCVIVESLCLFHPQQASVIFLIRFLTTQNARKST